MSKTTQTVLFLLLTFIVSNPVFAQEATPSATLTPTQTPTPTESITSTPTTSPTEVPATPIPTIEITQNPSEGIPQEDGVLGDADVLGSTGEERDFAKWIAAALIGICVTIAGVKIAKNFNVEE